MENIVSAFLKKLWIVLVESFSSFRKNNDLTAASSLAFSAGLALIPALFLLTSMLGMAIGSSQQAMLKTQELMNEVIPRYSQAILREVTFITTHTRAIGIVNVVILLWAITPLVSEMRHTLNAIFRTKPERPFLLEKLLDVSITVVFLIGVSAVAVAGVMVTLAERLIPLRFLTHYVEGVAPFFFVTAVIFLFYHTFAPRVPFRRLMAGAVVTSLLWFTLRPVFNLFLTYNPGYGFTFGSFKSLFIVIIWIYCSLSVFLFGAEIAASLNRGDIIFIKRLIEGKATIPASAMTRSSRRYEKGSVIFAEGGAGEEMFFVLRGSVAIRRDGKEIAVIQEKNYFGEMSFLLSRPRSAEAVALDDVELIAISNETVVILMHESPEFVLSMLREMATRLRETSRLIT